MEKAVADLQKINVAGTTSAKSGAEPGRTVCSVSAHFAGSIFGDQNWG